MKVIGRATTKTVSQVTQTHLVRMYDALKAIRSPNELTSESPLYKESAVFSRQNRIHQGVFSRISNARWSPKFTKNQSMLIFATNTGGINRNCKLPDARCANVYGQNTASLVSLPLISDCHRRNLFPTNVRHPILFYCYIHFSIVKKIQS